MMYTVLKKLRFVIFAVILSVPAFSVTDQELIDFVTTGAKQNCQRITSGKGTVTVSEFDTKSGRHTDEIITGVFSGERYKLITKRDTDGPELSEVTYDGTTTLVWRKDVGANPAVQILAGRPPSHAGRFDAFFNPRACLSVEEASPAFTAIRREQIDGTNFVVFQREAEASEGDRSIATALTVWVDVDKGFTVQKIEAKNTVNGVTTRLVTTNQVKQYADGIWAFSKRATAHYDADGNKVREKTITNDDDFQLNIPVNEPDLEAVLPSGTTVHDAVLDAAYTIP